ncbi:MAG: hypothetical protein J4428_03725 [Candidatus Aenigmarchaeota archaeon]|nr:hypothetical protein [Candidatus Aenigmarchaeota archaeon]
MQGFNINLSSRQWLILMVLISMAGFVGGMWYAESAYRPELERCIMQINNFNNPSPLEFPTSID